MNKFEIPTKIVPGMYWCQDEFTFTVANITGTTAAVKEEWTAYDTGKELQQVHNYKIGKDNGTEYVYNPSDPNWRFYASSAFGVI